MASRVVPPNTLTLPLSEGDWIIVKQRLNAGEHRRMLSRGYSYTDEGMPRYDTIAAAMGKILAYLVDWSLVGLDGHVIPIRDQSAETIEASVNSLEPETYTELLRAIETHETAMIAERTEEKKRRAGAITSSTISLSPSGSGGGTNG